MRISDWTADPPSSRRAGTMAGRRIGWPEMPVPGNPSEKVECPLFPPQAGAEAGKGEISSMSPEFWGRSRERGDKFYVTGILRNSWDPKGVQRRTGTPRGSNGEQGPQGGPTANREKSEKQLCPPEFPNFHNPGYVRASSKS